MKQHVTTLEAYLNSLPLERKGEVERVWKVVRESVPAGYTEATGEKFLTFAADNEWLVALANQKNYVSLYLMPLYIFPQMKVKFDTAASKKLKCGKSCINFLRADELPLEEIAEILTSCPAAEEYKARVRELRNDCK